MNIKKLELIRELLHHRRLANKRSYDYAKSKAAKCFLAFSMIVVVAYLVGTAIMFSLIVNESKGTSAPEFLCVVLPFILFIDFALRFVVQQTPAQIVKPYVLLPLPKGTCIDTFIFDSLFCWGNMPWFALILPYCLMSVVFAYGLATSTMLIAYAAFLILANSQWYAIVRVLLLDSIRWWILPVGIYALGLMPMYIGGDMNFDAFADFYSYPGSAIELHNPLPLIGALTLLVGLTAINRWLQTTYVRRELTHTDKPVRIKSIRQLGFLEHFGELGTFLQLELKLTLRNKGPRQTIIYDSFAIVVISLLIIFSDIYNSSGMTNFWGLYNFMLYGLTMCPRFMGYEGNYIDGLMVRREPLYEILRAKYIFLSILIIVPFVLMLPVVIVGKWSLYMVVSYAIYTIGCQYFLMFQMAVYNKQTIPLNVKLTSRNGMENGQTQMIMMGAIFILPNILVSLLLMLFGENVAYTIMLVAGLAFVATNRLWLNNIYKRIMKRRYDNMEAFRASRE